jgi:hypothetical protein
MSSSLSPSRRDLEAEKKKRRLLARAAADPAWLISFMSAPDERRGTTFSFEHLRDPLGPGEVFLDGNEVKTTERDWRWQRFFIETLVAERRVIALKARQLGATWDVCALFVQTALYHPGCLQLIYRQKEEEAWENVARCHQLLLSLPRWLWNGAEVVKPTKGALGGRELGLRFPGGARSRILAMTSASASGHGKTAKRILLDEHSRIERAGEIGKAVQPAAGSEGSIYLVSTANGVSDQDSGEGNQFHYHWTNAEEGGFKRLFLPWRLHPDRDQHWYDHDPEVRGLKTHERAEQYPANEDEAFTLTNRVFFDPDDLAHYSKLKAKLLYRFDFEKTDAQHAKFRKHDRGMVTVYAEPRLMCPGRAESLPCEWTGRTDESCPRHPDVIANPIPYAIGADVASGHGSDYSAAYVVDLSNMELAAEFHGRLGEDQYAYQLHFLGRWYNTALIAVETAGGWGNAVIIPLRDGREGRPAYPKLYRHILSSHPDLPVSKPFGFPTNTATRPKIINGMEKAVRERTLPWVTDGLLKEMQTFVRHDHGPSPAAQQGTRDDRVLAACITLEMYRQKGHHPDRKHRKPRSPRRRWQRLVA